MFAAHFSGYLFIATSCVGARQQTTARLLTENLSGSAALFSSKCELGDLDNKLSSSRRKDHFLGARTQRYLYSICRKRNVLDQHSSIAGMHQHL